jgi:hypothetical protein
MSPAPVVAAKNIRSAACTKKLKPAKPYKKRTKAWQLKK